MSKEPTEEVNIRVARIHGTVLALILAILCGFGLFVMTIWLVIKGGPDPGAHLQLLSQYFPGYSVTVLGSFVGLVYGMALGGIVGWAIGGIYNRVARQ